jgi:hypothetical protein
VRGQIVQLALDEPELPPRELATRFTDSKLYFVSEASVYRLLKDHDPSPSSTRASDPGGRPKQMGHPMGALTALAERGCSAWHPPFDEGPVIGTAFDHRVYDARHPGGNSGERLAPEVRVVAILGDATLEFVSKAVPPLADCDLSGDPKSSTQAGIA